MKVRHIDLSFELIDTWLNASCRRYMITEFIQLFKSCLKMKQVISTFQSDSTLKSLAYLRIRYFTRRVSSSLTFEKLVMTSLSLILSVLSNDLFSKKCFNGWRYLSWSSYHIIGRSRVSILFLLWFLLLYCLMENQLTYSKPFYSYFSSMQRCWIVSFLGRFTYSGGQYLFFEIRH